MLTVGDRATNVCVAEEPNVIDLAVKQMAALESDRAALERANKQLKVFFLRSTNCCWSFLFFF